MEALTTVLLDSRQRWTTKHVYITYKLNGAILDELIMFTLAPSTVNLLLDKLFIDFNGNKMRMSLKIVEYHSDKRSDHFYNKCVVNVFLQHFYTSKTKQINYSMFIKIKRTSYKVTNNFQFFQKLTKTTSLIVVFMRRLAIVLQNLKLNIIPMDIIDCDVSVFNYDFAEYGNGLRDPSQQLELGTVFVTALFDEPDLIRIRLIFSVEKEIKLERVKLNIIPKDIIDWDVCVFNQLIEIAQYSKGLWNIIPRSETLFVMVYLREIKEKQQTDEHPLLILTALLHIITFFKVIQKIKNRMEDCRAALFIEPDLIRIRLIFSVEKERKLERVRLNTIPMDIIDWDVCVFNQLIEIAQYSKGLILLILLVGVGSAKNRIERGQELLLQVGECSLGASGVELGLALGGCTEMSPANVELSPPFTLECIPYPAVAIDEDAGACESEADKKAGIKAEKAVRRLVNTETFFALEKERLVEERRRRSINNVEDTVAAAAVVGRSGAAAAALEVSTIVGATVAAAASEALATVGATAAAAAAAKIGKNSSRLEAAAAAAVSKTNKTSSRLEQAAAKQAQANDTSGSGSGSAGTANGKPAKT